MSIESSVTPFFSVTRFGEAYLPSVNRKLFDHQTSNKLFERKYPNLFTKENHLYVIVGTDSGLLANYVLEHKLPKGSRYLFVELESVMALMNIEIPEDRADRVQVHSLATFCDVIEQDPLPVYFIKKATRTYKSQGAKFAYITEYISLNSKVEEIMEQQTFFHSDALNQKMFIKRQLENVADNLVPAKVLSNSFPGKDCVILAGGPSLDDILPWVINHQEELVIFAVSRICRQLCSIGLIPDIVVSVDPYEASFDVSKEMLKLPESVLFINSNHTESRLLSNWHGPSAYLGTYLPWNNEENDSNISTAGPTVTNATIRVAAAMGFKQILLVGTDLCYSSNGDTHAKGSLEAAAGPNMGIIGEWVDTYNGSKAETSIQMVLAQEELACEVEHLQKGQRIFNLSANAAIVKGIEHRPTSNIQLSGTLDKHSVITNLTQPLQNKERIQKLLSARHQIKLAYKSLKKIQKGSFEALKINNTIKENNSKNNEAKYSSLLEKIDNIEQKLSNHHRSIYQLIKFFGYAEFSQFLTPTDSNEWQEQDLIFMTDSYYKAVHSTSKQLAPLISCALQKVNLRLEELSNSANSKVLFCNWSKFQEYGRAIIWQKSNMNTLSRQEQQHVQLMIEKYNELINQKSDYSKRIDISHSLLDQVERKILLLHNTHNDFGLSQLAAILKNKSAKDKEAGRLYRLADCFYHQLKGEHSLALGTLLKLDESQLTEREFKEMASLGLKVQKPEISLLALNKLIEYSDEYYPLYASVLKLTGQYQNAAETYLEYLNKYPGDVVTWIKFGQFMVEAGERDMAINAFHQAEQADPGNAVAKHYLSELYHQ